MSSHSGRNARVVLGEIVRLGGAVDDCPGTGEIRVSHPLLDYKVRTQHPSRRKDASRRLEKFLRDVERAIDRAQSPEISEAAA